MVYPRGCSMYTWEEWVLALVVYSCIYLLGLVYNVIQVFYSLLIYCLNGLPIISSRIQKSWPIMVELSISPFNSVNVFSYLLELCCSVRLYLLLYLLDKLILLSINMPLYSVVIFSINIYFTLYYSAIQLSFAYYLYWIFYPILSFSTYLCLCIKIESLISSI